MMTAFELYRGTGRTTMQLEKLIRNLPNIPEGPIILVGKNHRHALQLLDMLEYMVEKRWIRGRTSHPPGIWVGARHIVAVSVESIEERTFRGRSIAYVYVDHAVTETDLSYLFGDKNPEKTRIIKRRNQEIAYCTWR